MHRLALIASVVSSLASAASEPAWQLLRSFENTPEGYVLSDGHQPAVTDTDSVHGAYSLMLEASFPGNVEIRKRGGIGRIGSVEIAVKAQPEAPGDLDAIMFIQDKDGLWWQSEPKRVLPGSVSGWRFLQFDLYRDFYPVNHGAAFERRFAAQVANIGFRFFSRKHWQGRLFLDRLRGLECREAPLSIRDLRPLTGATVPLYRAYEAEFRAEGAYFNPFDADEISVEAIITAPSGTEITLPCFFYQSFERLKRPEGQDLYIPRGAGTWRLRYAPIEPGVHRLKVRATCAGESAEAGGLEFAGAAGGETLAPIRVSKANPFAFETIEGEPFYPIGHNIRSPTDSRCSGVLGWSPLADRGISAYERYLPLMAANGENLLEVWMASWWLDIEWTSAWKGYHGLGRYNLEHAWLLDYLLELAYQNRLYVHLVVDNHGKVSSYSDQEWHFSPYNRRNGGFLDSPDQFFIDPRAKKQHRQKLRYIIARWSAYTNIMGLELISELDLTGSRHGTYRSPYVLDWLRETAEYVRSLDPYRRPISTHFSGDFNVIDPKIAQDPCLDYVVVDAYRGGVGPVAPLMHSSSRALGRFGKPFFITEYGGAWNGTDEAGLRADLHCGIWSAACSRSAGTPLLWWFDFIDSKNLYTEYAALARFLDGEDQRRTGDWRELELKLGGGISAVLFFDDTEGRGWIYDASDMTYLFPERLSAQQGASIVLPLKPGCRYTVEFWETGKGGIMDTRQVEAAGDGFRVALPDFQADLALKWRLEERQASASTAAAAGRKR